MLGLGVMLMPGMLIVPIMLGRVGQCFEIVWHVREQRLAPHMLQILCRRMFVRAIR